ncbi:hypothetical protein [Escherichia coli]|nr:hypothetical protein [Escherichia coli]ESD57430.1 hypothetical protein HMPREF1606_02280 [Escherichia coli 908522]
MGDKTEKSFCRVLKLLTSACCEMPDAAQTPYPAYKSMQIQYIAEFMQA